MDFGGKFVELLGTIFAISASVAIVALIVSKKSNTVNVTRAWFSGTANQLAVAEAPVTGARANPVLSYPGQGGGGGIPMLDLGAPFMG